MNFLISKRTPSTNKHFVMLVLGMDLDLIVAWKSIHKWKYLASNTFIDNSIYERCGKVFLSIGFVQISKIHANTDSTLFFIHGNKIRYPFHQGKWIYKTRLKEFFHLFLYFCIFSWINWSNICVTNFTFS